MLWVASGGALGSVLRYLLSRWIQLSQPGPFPLGTLAVNLTGSLLIGILFGYLTKTETGSEDLRLLMMTGFCGGFTTFSALTLESLHLIRDNRTGLFFLYISVSLLLGIAATYAGWRIIK
ncbi:MAG: fluoride efflux transporter CrcB [Chitinophagaceae bacterium]|nr:fluoride efflux transporter CrcB [Chitinophagaceae bacterium]MBN8668471.1 fluoride efflux transporter CrcB [Chitinophagales bacterium]